MTSFSGSGFFDCALVTRIWATIAEISVVTTTIWVVRHLSPTSLHLYFKIIIKTTFRPDVIIIIIIIIPLLLKDPYTHHRQRQHNRNQHQVAMPQKRPPGVSAPYFNNKMYPFLIFIKRQMTNRLRLI